YLTARQVGDSDEAGVLFRKATEGKPPCAYAWYGLWYDAMSQCDFPRALECIRNARKLEPKEPGFAESEAETLEALHKPGDAEAVITSLQSGPEPERDTLIREIRLLIAKGDVPAARAKIDGYCQHLANKYKAPAEVIERIRTSLETSLYYA